MDCFSYETASDPCRVKPIKLYRQPQLPKLSSSLSWFDLRVFYVRISNITVGVSTPEYLTLTPTPLAADTLLEVNGARVGIYSDGPASILRRDRIDRRPEEATFVGTDSVRLTGSLKFEVFDRDQLVLSGALELSDVGRWSMSCEAPQVATGVGFLKGKPPQGMPGTGEAAPSPPAAEVYVAGLFAGTPAILTEVVQLGCRRKMEQYGRKEGTLDSIPENESTQKRAPGLDWQAAANRNYKLGYEEEEEEDDLEMHWRTQYAGDENGELSWFNAGVRVGVGIGLGICLGVGIGVGLLVQTARGFRRRLL